MKSILMTAYDINPFKGSESGTGWNFVIQSARFNKVIAITRENNQINIDRYVSIYKPNISNVTFLYFDLPKYLRFWKKKARGSSLYFYLWQMFVPLFVKKSNIKFDIAHNLNFHADAFPTFLWILGKPVVWGPVCHNEKIPKNYIKSRIEFFKDRSKWVIKKMIWNLDPFMYLAKKKVKFIIGGNSSVQRRMKVCDEKFIKMTQVASLPPEKIGFFEDHDFNVLFVGRFLTIKSVDIAILAFDDFYKRLDELERKEVKLIIIGQGPHEERVKNIAQRAGSESVIHFKGWVEKDQVAQYFKSSKVFLFPSHEGAGMVVVEALSYGLPVICFDNYGPGELVNDNCAIRIPYSDFEESVKDYSIAMQSLYRNRKLQKDKSKAAHQLFEEKYTWDIKGRTMQNIYDKIG